MNNLWYEIVDVTTPITQGDIIFDCPIVTWEEDTLVLQDGFQPEKLTNAVTGVACDVIVMTQACDLEQKKVPNVILCPHNGLIEYKKGWEEKMHNIGENITAKSWKSHCDDICDGFIWNLSMLNEGKLGDLTIETRIVDFRDIFNIPRLFLESLLQHRNTSRFRLLPPYREHLSQAFARFFMRVGLPVSIAKNW